MAGRDHVCGCGAVHLTHLGICTGCMGRGHGRTVTRTGPTEWAKAVVRHTPVTRFVVTDFTPAASAQHQGWFRWYAGEARGEVPQPVFDLLAGEHPEDRHGVALVPYWRTVRAAHDALDVAVSKWVRGVNG